MEIVVIVIMLLVSFSLMLKLTYLPLYGKVAVGLACALFVGLNLESATAQSKTQIDDWLHNPELMLDIAVLLTIDVALQIVFCILYARRLAGEKLSKTETVTSQLALWIPGILIIPTLFALLTEAIFALPGYDFGAIAWTLAGVVFVVAVGMSSLIPVILPEKDLRLELIFMFNAMIALLGIVATVNGRTAVDGSGSVEWMPLLGVVTLLALGAVAGYVLFNHNIHKKLSNIK